MIDYLGALTLVSMLQQVLDDVVPVLICGQLEGVWDDFFHQWFQLLVAQMFQHPLQDPAAVLMHRKRKAPASEGIEHESEFFFLQVLDAFLDDVVSVLVFDQSQNVSSDFFNEEFLQFLAAAFQCLLHYPAPIHLQRQTHYPLVLSRPELQQLLDYIVPKHVIRYRQSVWQHLFEHQLLLLQIGALEALLNQSRPVLVLAR